MDYIEQDCTIEIEGKTFESGGAVVTPDAIVAYLGKNGSLQDWHGNELGNYRISASWRVNSYVSSHMHQVYAWVDGVRYTGRSGGEGMLFKGRKTKR